MSVIKDARFAMERIDVAMPDSQIAVFRFEGVKNKNKESRIKWETVPGLECLFANTAMTQKRIKDKDKRFIGTFDRSMDMASVREQLIDELYTLERA